MNKTLADTADTADTQELLLGAVADLTAQIEAGVPHAETQGQLDPAVVDALVDRRLWQMRLVHEFGGFESTIATQFEVLLALAAVDTATAWCTMVANNAVGLIGAYMPETVTREVFANGPDRCAVVIGPAGTATAVDGGYRLTGIWRFSSSVRHANWVLANTCIDGDPERPFAFVLPADEIRIHDNWQVHGLRGTGSCDFEVVDHFVPTARTLPGTLGTTSPRGSRNYFREDVDHIETYEHTAIALGIATRALAEARSALARRRGLVVAADREAVQTEFAELSIRLESTLLAARALCERLDRIMSGEVPVVAREETHKARAFSVLATDFAVECAEFAFRRTGRGAIYTPNTAEKLLRDAHSARLHFLVNDSAVAAHGLALIDG